MMANMSFSYCVFEVYIRNEDYFLSKTGHFNTIMKKMAYTDTLYFFY